ncbi:sulfurase [uncultured Tateyamaria sp.]|uniref:MOSC domain-containing protein n=1 Tax=uncultured Tateyamaria sp. TaxID=455651 RepID=UPI002622C2DB|nr:sulfurase [uncultured Tateyamaria sp.]
MPALKPTSFSAQIVWLGHVPDRTASLRAVSVDAVEATLDGFPGEAHGGATRPSCVRVKSQYPQGTTIRNVRQLSVLSAEELALTAAEMGMEAIDPALVGASMVIEGIPDVTYLPPASRLQAPSGASLVVDMENRPCTLPAREIEREAAGFGARYKPAAKGRRGVTAWIECAGRFAVGDRLVLHVPDQPVWAHLDAARKG